MIVTKDIEEILIKDMKSLINVNSIFTDDDEPLGVISAERVTIHAKSVTPHTYFKKGFVEVNWSVPDIGDKPDSIRLQEVERLMVGSLDKVDVYDGTPYRYSPNSHEVLKSPLKCHYVNVRLLFEILNVL